MQDRHRIHESHAAEMWPRCTQVELRDDQLHCELALNRQYDLVDAYRLHPHIQFLNCKSDEDPRVFTRTWGPLYLVQTRGAEDIRLGKAIRRLDDYNARHRWLRAVKGMIEACRDSKGERESLLEYLAAEGDMYRTGPSIPNDQTPHVHFALQCLFRYEGDPLDWAAVTDIGTIRRALAWSVETNLTAPSGYGVRVRERRGRLEIQPGFYLGSLWDALRWMLWLDEWNNRPAIVCQECSKIFVPSTAHKMKYCTHVCAHRATNRKWRQKDLAKRKVNRERKGGTNVSRKTR